MKNKLLFSIAFVALSVSGFAQSVTIGGEVEKPYQLTPEAFKGMKQVTVKGTGHDGKPHDYSGVLLNDIITQAGGLPNNQLRGKSLAKYLLIKAADGYRAVIALAEINPEFNDKNIILANKIDGKTLEEKTGPYQLVIPGEKKWGRWVRQVNEIDLQTAKD